ncbi:MAG TPA: Crp/Fnr family transcriptional regulator [Bacteroidales bacterium]|nr:Crp/Fnr family transcriptional regulator [Bacteroidales bacterium]
MKTITETDNDFFCDIQAPCFQLLTKEEIEQVQASRTQVLFRKGENLTKQGAFASYVLFIVTGFVKQVIEGDGNKGYNLKIVRPGEFLGLSSVFGKSTFDYSAIALTDVQTFLIEKEAIARLISSDGKFAFSIIKRYCEQNSLLFDSISKLVYKQMNGRLAETLLYLSPEDYTGINIFTVLSRKDIAEFAGISTESTVKLLKTFEKDGLIRLKDKDIILLNREALKEISRRG